MDNSTTLTASQKVKQLILLEYASSCDDPDQDLNLVKSGADDIDAEFSRLDADGALEDAKTEVYFQIGCFTGDVRNHDRYSRVADCPDGSLVAWDTQARDEENDYCPDANSDWIDTAYDVVVTGQKTIVYNTYAKVTA